jgi:hypothetical protein
MDVTVLTLFGFVISLIGCVLCIARAVNVQRGI